MAATAIEESDDNESNISSAENKSYNNNNNNSHEKNNNSIMPHISASNSPTHTTSPKTTNTPTNTNATTDLLTATTPFGTAAGHLPHNLHPAAAAQFMAALAMQQQQQQHNNINNNNETSPTSHLLAFNGHHHHANSHLLQHHQQHQHQHQHQPQQQQNQLHSFAGEMDTRRSTSSPGSCGGSDNNSAASSISGPYQCLHCPATFQNRHELEKHELMHSPNAAQSPQSQQNGVNQVSASSSRCPFFASLYTFYFILHVHHINSRVENS